MKRHEVFAEFEVFFTQLLHHKSHSNEQFSGVQAKLNDVAHSYCNTLVDVGDCLMKNECLQALKSFRSNSDVLITKLDKESGVVVLDKSDYILKMEKILYNPTKFELIGSSCDPDGRCFHAAWAVSKSVH